MIHKLAVINIGNTGITAAWAEQGRLTGSVSRFSTRDILTTELPGSALDRFLQHHCLIACVVPQLKQKLKSCYSHVRFLDVTMVAPTGLDFSQVDSSTLGGDRIANAVAAVDFQPPPVLVVDCGTAVTIEVVDRDRVFRGGAILPGRSLQREILQSRTGLLPQVDLSDSLPLCPAVNTREAIRAGVDLGIAGAVNGLLREIRKLAGCRLAGVLLAGGDGPFFAPLIPEAVLMGEDFTLRGLAVVAGAQTVFPSPDV